jgi:hypothetical protein
MLQAETHKLLLSLYPDTQDLQAVAERHVSHLGTISKQEGMHDLESDDSWYKPAH